MILRPQWLRAVLADVKAPVSGKAGDTGWSSGEIPPRYSYIDKSRPAGRGWEWRSATCEGLHGKYRLFFHVSPSRGKWKAWLASLDEERRDVILRLESQDGAFPGLHIHAHCGNDTKPKGAEGINGGYRLPDHQDYHRRVRVWTKSSFVYAACDMLNVRLPADPEDLFDDD